MTTSTSVAIRSGRPLAPMQRGLWMSQRRHPAAPLLNMVKLTRFGGPVDVDRLVAAFARVVEASATLATRIVDDGSGPVVQDVSGPALTEVLDLPAADALAWAEERLRTPIDVAVRPYDSVVLRHPDGTASWYLGLHHLVTDAASSALVFAQTAAVYHGDEPTLASYEAWVRRAAGDDSARAERARRHWAERRSAPGLGRLYRPVRREAPDSHRVPVPGLVAPSDDYRLLTDEMTWTVFLATATAALVGRVTGAETFSIGLPVHNRTVADAQHVVGPVMEVFPLDVHVDTDDTFASLHKRVAKATMATIRHAVPGTAPAGDYEVVVNVIPGVELGPFGDIPVEHYALDAGAIDAGHLLRVQLNAYGEGGEALLLDVNDAAADADHRRRIGGHLATVLAAMVDDPDQPVHAVDLVSAGERDVLSAWETGADFGNGTPAILGTLASALTTSDAVVIDDGVAELTGAELWSRSLRLAHWLRAEGVSTGDRVGIHMPRSIDTVTAVLGTLLAGGSYVPLDPTQPTGRIERLVERAGCVIVLRALPDLDEIPVAAPSWTAPEPDDEAYLLFTSGSTAEPKGVPITHLGLARYVRFAAESYTRGEPEVVAFFSALTFDLTVTSLFVPLVTTARPSVKQPRKPQLMSCRP